MFEERRTEEDSYSTDELRSDEFALIAIAGGAFDWLKDEPDIYSDEDGLPVNDLTTTTNVPSATSSPTPVSLRIA
jgi:hypothetical protein